MGIDPTPVYPEMSLAVVIPPQIKGKGPDTQLKIIGLCLSGHRPIDEPEPEVKILVYAVTPDAALQIDALKGDQSGHPVVIS